MKLGMKLRDKITGFEGVALARTEYLYGCVRYGLQPKGLKDDGGLQQIEYFDEAQLTVVEEVEEYTRPTTGGPRPAPKRARDPRR